MTTSSDKGNPTFTEADIRTIVALLSDVIADGGTLGHKRKTFMRGLASLADADAWYWVRGQRVDADSVPVAVDAIHEGFDEHQIAAFIESRYDDGGPPEWNAQRKALDNNGSKPITHLREQLIDDEQWRETWTEGKFNQRIGFDHWVDGLIPAPDGHLITNVRLLRCDGRPRFTNREQLLTQILITESRWLHTDEAARPDPRLDKLSPRLRMVFRLLMEGMSTKQIASHLGLSAYTVQDYTRAVYRHLGVSRRVDLIRRYMQ